MYNMCMCSKPIVSFHIITSYEMTTSAKFLKIIKSLFVHVPTQVAIFSYEYLNNNK